MSNAPEITKTPEITTGDESVAPLVTASRLRDVGLFGALGDEVLDSLASTLQRIAIAPGEMVFREGDGCAREMYVVIDGELEILRKSRRGRDTRVAILGPNDFFGGMSMIDMQVRAASVRAIAPCQLLKFTSEDLNALYRADLRSYALIVLNIARDLSRRLRVADGILADFALNWLDQYADANRP